MHNLDWSLKMTFEHCWDVPSSCVFVHVCPLFVNLCLRLSRGFVAGLRQRKPISRRKLVAVETSRPKTQLHFWESWESWVAHENMLVLAIRQRCLSSCGVVFFCFPHAAWPFKATVLMTRMTREKEALLQPTWPAMSFRCFLAAWRVRMRLLSLLRLLVTSFKSFVSHDCFKQ